MPPITKQEKDLRQRSMASALGSNEMEGLFADKPTLAIIERYIQGELTPDQFSEAMDGHAASLVRRTTFAGAA